MKMNYILSLVVVVVCFAVLTAGQSADLSIGVSYTSLQGELVSYQLFHGDERSIEVFIDYINSHVSNKNTATFAFLSNSQVAMEF